jgi:hypothetical protein
MSYEDEKLESMLLSEKQEKVFENYATSRPWDGSLIAIGVVFVIALCVVGGVAEKSLNFWAPNKPVPTSGVVVSEPANVPTPTPAYPEVYVQKSSDPSQAPSPLPPGPPAVTAQPTTVSAPSDGR